MLYRITTDYRVIPVESFEYYLERLYASVPRLEVEEVKRGTYL